MFSGSVFVARIHQSAEKMDHSPTVGVNGYHFQKAHKNAFPHLSAGTHTTRSVSERGEGLVRDRIHDHIRANLQGVFILHAVAIRMRKLLPTVAQVEFAVNHRQAAIDRDPL